MGVLIIGIAMSSNPTRLRGELSVLVARAEVEIVCICAPSGLHAAIGEEVVRAGKHVVVEKPIATTLKAADQLIWSARASGVMLSVISQHRFDPGVVELKQLIEKGARGEFLFGEASVKWFREASYYTGSRWRGTQEMGGGGALINQGIHYTDLLCWCMGPVAEVTALCDARAHEIEVEDIAVAMLRFRSGALGTVVASTSLYPGLPERLEVSGTAGSVIVENGVRVYEAVRGQGTLGGLSLGAGRWPAGPSAGGSGATDSEAIGYEGHARQIADVLQALDDGGEPTVTGEEARRTLEVVEAIYESARRHCAVSLTQPQH